MLILTLVLMPLVTGLSQAVSHPYQASWSPYHTVSPPYNAVDSPYHHVISSYGPVLLPYHPVSSPYQSPRSIFNVGMHPSQLVRSPYYVESSPYQQVLQQKSSPSKDVLSQKNSSPPNEDLPDMTSDNFIRQSRQKIDLLKKIQRKLALNPTATKYIDRVVEASNCIDSLDDAVETIDNGTKLIENSESEILELVETVRALGNLTDIPTIMRTSASILQWLDILIPKIVPREKPTVCETSQEATIEALHTIAQVLEDIAEDDNLHLSEDNKKELKTSANIITTVFPFLEYLQTSLSKFNKMCTLDKEYNFNALYAVADIMDKLADLFIGFGNYKDAKTTREGARITRKVVVGIRQMSYFDLETLEMMECDDSDFLKNTANTLVDLADIITDVGIENLGLDLKF